MVMQHKPNLKNVKIQIAFQRLCGLTAVYLPILDTINSCKFKRMDYLSYYENIKDGLREICLDSHGGSNPTTD